MLKKTFAETVITLLLTSMVMLAVNIQPIMASETIYIRADGSIDPPTAPIERNGNVYTLTGNITSDTDGIVVERSNIIIDGRGYTLQSVDGGTGIRLSGSSNVTVKSANIKHFYVGIMIMSSNNTKILNNNLVDNWNTDISIFEASNNTISGNNMTNMRLVAESCAGIRLGSSSNNSILGNIFVNGGLWVDESYGNLVKNNLVNGKSLVYLEGTANHIVDNAGQVILVNCDNISVQNLDLSNTISGLQLWETNNSKITNNNVTNNQFGMMLYSSSNNSIIENNVIENRNGPGITLLYSSSYNIISQNNIVNNREHGISLHVSSSNTISGNNITGNMWMGIDLSISSNNNVSLNTLAKNGNDGISLWYSSNNSISLNTVTSNWRSGVDLSRNSSNNTICGNSIRNNEYGVYIYSSELSPNNRIYHNDFINNVGPIGVSGQGNSWDDGYPSGGNYWSDHNPPDQDFDKIGDTPYTIDENNADRYPLIYPYGFAPNPDVNNDKAINILDISTVAIAFGCKPGDLRWNPIVDMDLNEAINILDLAAVAMDYGKTV